MFDSERKPALEEPGKPEQCVRVHVLKRIALGFAWVACGANLLAGEGRWVATWTTAQQLTEVHNLPPAPGFSEATVRQKMRVSIGGQKVRLRFSNEYGEAPITFEGIQLARSAGDGAIATDSVRALAFDGATAVTLAPGMTVCSDPLDFLVAPMADLAVTLRTQRAPRDVTGHPGSRTTSYFDHAGAALDAADLSQAMRVDHWYFLCAIEVWTERPAAAVVVIGDSLTDGRGSTTNGNDRWPDMLSRRLRANPATADVAVLNQAIGGGRVLRDGLGPSAVARFERDVIAQPGVRWLILFEGINDIGTAVGDRAHGVPAVTADDLIAAYEKMIDRAHACGIRVYGGTIMPFAGFTSYYTPEAEADRQAVNHWIRTSGRFDAVIDFDAIARDPLDPARLSAAVDGGDHLHLSAAGYAILAGAIDLALFAP